VSPALVEMARRGGAAGPHRVLRSAVAAAAAEVRSARADARVDRRHRGDGALQSAGPVHDVRPAAEIVAELRAGLPLGS
jgi:hypothetical protein